MRTDRDSFESFNFQVPSRQKDAKPAVRSESIFAPQLFMQVVAGTSTDGYSGDTGPATLAQLRAFIPWVDTNGNIFIPDRDNFRIRRVIPSGIITTFGGTGTQSSTGTSGPISSVSFFNPFSIVGDMGGTVLYISDMLYVWKYSVSSNIVTVFAQSTTLGVGFSGDNGPARSAQLQNPRGLWLTSSGELFIADKNNHRIRSVSSTGIIRTVAGSGSPAAGGFSGDTGPALLASLSSPGGVYVDSSGILFIADCDNNRIRVVAVNNIITTFAGTGVDSPYNNDNIPALSANMLPHDVKGDSMGNIYLADWGNCVIRMIAKSDSIISTLFGTPGSCGFSAGLTGRSAVISGPRGIWVDSASTIYFSDYISIHRGVTVSAPSSQPTTQPSAQPSRQPSRQPTSSPTEHLRLYNNVFMQLVAGTNTSGYSGDNSPATSARIKSVIPWVDTSGNIYIPDGENYRIRKVNSAGIITTFGGTGVGSSAGTSGPIGSTSFGQLWCIVGDTGGTALYISDLRYVWKYVFSTNVATVFAHGTNLALGFSGDNSLASVAQLYYPEGIWLTTSGDLYIADYGNHRIRKVSAGIITTVAGSGCDSDCTGSFSGDNGPATSATLNHPRSVYVASNSHFFIADLHNHRVRVVNANNIIITFAGSGSASPFNGDYIPKESTNLNGIQDVKGDSLGNIYITESNNCIIRVVVIGIISTLFGTPGSCAFTPGTSSRSASIKSPFGICLDTLSRIYVSDTNSIHRSFSVSSPTSQPSSQPSRQPTSQPTTQPTRQPSSSPTSHRTDMSCETFRSINGWTKPSRIACNVNTASGYYWKVTLKVGEYGTSGFCSSGVYPGCNSTAIGTSGQTYSWKDWDVPWFEVSTNWCRRPSGGGCGCPADGPISSCPSDDITVFCGRYSAVCTAIPASAVIPSSQPSRQPSSRPSQQPSSQPSRKPTAQPSRQPSSQPTRQPTIQIPLTLRTSLVAYYPFDGNANDNSGNGNHGVVHGGVSLATDRFGNPRNAYSFNGISGYIEIPGTQFNFESTMSVVMWISASNNQSTFAGVFDKSYSQTAQGWGGWLIERNPNGGCSGCYMLYYPIAPTGADAFNTPSVKLSTNVWNHFAVTKNNNVTSAFLNGVLIHKVSGASPMKSNQNLPLIIGAQNSGRTSPASSLSSFFPGFIDDIFIYNRSLSATEIQSIFNFDNPTSQPSRLPTAQPSRQPSAQPTRQPTIQLPLSLRTSLVAYYPFDGNANDNSGNGNHGVVHGGVSLVSDRFGNTRNAYSFDGSSGYIEVKGGSQLNLITNITISFWMNPGSYQGNYTRLFSNYGGGFLIAQNKNLQGSYYVEFYSFQKQYALWNFRVTLNVWNHVVVMKIENMIRFYVNGILQLTGHNVFNWVYTPNVNLPLIIGAGSASSAFFNGALDDTAIFNRSLSTAEILMLNQFELPTGQPSTQPTRQPIPVPTSQPSRQPTLQPTSFISGTLNLGLVAYYPFDGNARDESGNGNNGQVHSTFLAGDRFGNSNQAYRFDGISSYIEVAHGNAFNFGKNFSLSLWVNPASVQRVAYAFIISKSHYPGGWGVEHHISSQDNHTDFFNYRVPTVASFPCVFHIIDNTWNHFVITRSGVTTKCYVNNVLKATERAPSLTPIVPNGNLPLTFGGCNGARTAPASGMDQFFSGILDDIFIYNRTLTLEEISRLSQFGAPTSQPSSRPSRQPSARPSNQPTRQPSCQPNARPTSQPSSQPTVCPSSQPTRRPSCQPNPFPTGIPTLQPTGCPSNQPSSQPSFHPSCVPTTLPFSFPSGFPSNQPTGIPSLSPSSSPSSQPTRVPTIYPTSVPSIQPSSYPSSQPTSFPSSYPICIPTLEPTGHPTRQPSSLPTSLPSEQPSSQPSTYPTSQPSSPPSSLPTIYPTNTPTRFPSATPSSVPSLRPSTQPSSFPSLLPTGQPSSQPSSKPSCAPFSAPSLQPTCRPSSRPSNDPTHLPTAKPSRQPSSQPTMQPSRRPSGQPTCKPSKQPSTRPSSQPSSSPISSFPTSEPTIITESPTPLRNPSISAYPSQTRKPTRQPITPRPTAIPTIRPSFIPTSAPTHTVSVFPSGNIDFKESLFFFGSYLPTLENIPNIYLTDETIGSSYIIFGFQEKEGRPKEINLGSRSSFGLYSLIMNNQVGLMQDHTMSRSVLPVGDFNGDTYKDLLICDPVNSICFVYCGHVNGLQNLRVSFAIKSDSNNLFGWSIAKINDINRDNLDDFAISALSSNVIYVFFGSKITTDIVVDEQLDSSIGITIIGSQNDQYTGLALSSAGDFNNDGYSDVLFSAIQISPYQNVIYILFFNSHMMKQNVIMDTLTSNKDYLKITAPLFCFAGFSLSNLGDINQDGFDDVIIGSIPYSGRYLTQKSYVVYGRNVSSPFSVTEIREEDGFTITGGGFMVGGPGDVNGDGIPDIMISSYQQWQGKWNSYIMVYPRNITRPPTFLPSSQPTSSPSLSPTSWSSIKVQDPTSTPTLQETTNEPVSEGTFPPFLGATQLPSLAPKTSKPTRVPSMKLTTHFPTVKTDLPSASPTRQPTESPTRRPTILPSTHRPSRYPTRQPISSVFPTSSPSRLSTESLSTNIKEIIIEKDGIYQLPGGEVNCVISGAGDFQITSYGDGKKIYTILPSKNTITITNFNRRYDHISLIHFPYLYSTKSLTYRTHPLQIILSNEQRLVLSSLAASDLTEENFIFHKDSENQKPISVQLSFASVISLGILMSCVGLTWFLVKVNGTDEADDFLSKDTLDSDENEKVEELESQHENIFSEISSNMLSSRSDSKDNSEGDSDNLSVKERVLESADDDDWNLFSSLASFFSSDDDPVITLKSVPDITVDSEDDEEQSFLFTESEEELDGHLDIEGNYK
jgi:hypothetical protein